MIIISNEDREFLRVNCPIIHEAIETANIVDILDLINRAIFDRCIDAECNLDGVGNELQLIYNRLNIDN
ncbi:MAG: hypothetical protein PHS94_07465 [Erysipelotrichaceae bacterium]|nr:hypothetical protein [Erysipelotrichaceae bacterium]